jgi:hypothetical protein
MRTIIAIVLWAGIPFCWQPLRGQSPSVGMQSGSNQKRTRKPDGSNANTNQRGTLTSPFIVDTHPRPDNPREAAEHKAENDVKEYRDRWMFNLAVFNALVAMVVAAMTGLLVLVGWRGVNAANRTLQLMKEEFIDAQEANASAKNIAQGSIARLEAQALAMAAQVDIMRQQTNIAEESAKATKDAAAAALLNAQAVLDTERPWFVASIEKRSEDSTDWRVRITNKGRTPGHLSHISAEHCLASDPEALPLPPKYNGTAWIPESRFFAAGDAFTVREWNHQWFNPEVIWENIRNSETELFVVYGRVRYKDTFTGGTTSEITHETRWSYLYRPMLGDFVPCGPAEYNGYRDHQRGEQKAN